MNFSQRRSGGWRRTDLLRSSKRRYLLKTMSVECTFEPRNWKSPPADSPLTGDVGNRTQEPRQCNGKVLALLPVIYPSVDILSRQTFQWITFAIAVRKESKTYMPKSCERLGCAPRWIWSSTRRLRTNTRPITQANRTLTSALDSHCTRVLQECCRRILLLNIAGHGGRRDGWYLDRTRKGSVILKYSDSQIGKQTVAVPNTLEVVTQPAIFYVSWVNIE